MIRFYFPPILVIAALLWALFEVVIKKNKKKEQGNS
jgi:hypothetical protein